MPLLSRKKPVAPDWKVVNAKAIEIVKNELERREQQLIDLRKSFASDDFSKGEDRDQFLYCMGRADECRELLACLGEHNWEVKTTGQMKKALGWR